MHQAPKLRGATEPFANDQGENAVFRPRLPWRPHTSPRPAFDRPMYIYILSLSYYTTYYTPYWETQGVGMVIGGHPIERCSQQCIHATDRAICIYGATHTLAVVEKLAHRSMQNHSTPYAHICPMHAHVVHHVYMYVIRVSVLQYDWNAAMPYLILGYYLGHYGACLQYPEAGTGRGDILLGDVE